MRRSARLLVAVVAMAVAGATFTLPRLADAAPKPIDQRQVPINRLSEHLGSDDLFGDPTNACFLEPLSASNGSWSLKVKPGNTKKLTTLDADGFLRNAMLEIDPPQIFASKHIYSVFLLADNSFDGSECTVFGPDGALKPKSKANKANRSIVDPNGGFTAFVTNKRGNSQEAKLDKFGVFDLTDKKLSDPGEPKAIKFSTKDPKPGTDISGFTTFGILVMDQSDECFDEGDCAHFMTPFAQFADFTQLLAGVPKPRN
ncbi:MAG: hypothetical protein IT307_08060 [Chloroflexi bacterium]|nr:hypothetical protein [Chloroflexota bacterium]